MNPTHKPYSDHDDELILMIITNRGELSQRKALAGSLHLLPGRTVDGLLSRYKVLAGRSELDNARQSALERKRQAKKQGQPSFPYGGRPGVVLTNWTDEEEALLWNAVETRPPDKGIHAELKDCVDLLPGRTISSITNRYYALRDRFAKEDDINVSPTPSETPSETPPAPPESQLKPLAPKAPPFTYNTLNGTVAHTMAGAYNSANFTFKPALTATWTPPAAQQVVQMPTAAVVEVAQAAETPPASRLADRAEEFIESLYSVVKENKDLRKQVQQLLLERANSLGRLEGELEAERSVNARMRKQIAELEDDRDAFLRLMDKARVIGREESGIK